MSTGQSDAERLSRLGARLGNWNDRVNGGDTRTTRRRGRLWRLIDSAAGWLYVTVERRAEQDRQRYHSADTTWLTRVPMGDGDDVALICVGCWHCAPDPGVYFAVSAERPNTSEGQEP